MTRGHPVRLPRPADPPVTQPELDELYAAAYADEPFVTVVSTPPATKHVTGQQPGPGPRPARRADRPDPRHRRRGQPRQGRRRPGGPGVQPGPRPAGDRRPRAAPAGAMTAVSHVSVPTSSPDLPPVERHAALPAGFKAGGLAAGIKASGRPDLAVIATTGGPAAAAAVFTPNALAAAPVHLSRKHLAATSGDPRGGFGLAEAIISTSGSANAATGPAGDADQLEIARLPRRGNGVGDSSGPSTSRRGSSGRDCRWTASRPVSTPSSRRSPRTTPGCRRSRRRCARPIRWRRWRRPRCHCRRATGAPSR